ncbi:MAG: metal-independent alpha-mannosidase [Bacteroidales bacterium 45-6]|nr:MAG: metal-independent alpha-mannosidase [Bacteroidales bacterium 45-6]
MKSQVLIKFWQTAFLLVLATQAINGQNFPEVRVKPEQRNFSSPPIEKAIQAMQRLMADKELAWMFGNCFPNTLDRTVKFGKKDGKYDTFVITGDIYAMWLRDCSAQVWPYMPYMKEDPNLQNLIKGVINRQVECVLIDPYANAFNFGKEGSEWDSDHTTMLPELHERKWEVDGLCYVIRLGYHYWKLTGDNSCFDGQWHKAMQAIVKTFKEQQRKESKGPYKFTRTTDKASDTQFGGGYGSPIKPIGLISSMFRPSDDATTFGFLVPSNCFAVVSLRQLAEMEAAIRGDKAFAKECADLATEVNNAIQKYAIVQHPKYGRIFAYEVDGFGNRLLMDDANVPSLLSLPYLGYVSKKDPVYLNTRKFVWSRDNPYFYKGTAGEGIGGPHVAEDMIWPMAIIMKALTSDNEAEIAACLRMLKHTHANTGFIHETFHKDDPANFTRSWFAWANTLFGELLLKVEKEHPALLKKNLE